MGFRLIIQAKSLPFSKKPANLCFSVETNNFQQPKYAGFQLSNGYLATRALFFVKLSKLNELDKKSILPLSCPAIKKAFFKANFPCFCFNPNQSSILFFVTIGFKNEVLLKF
ncbi:MAG: hypothetical protein IT258_06300 [Saprospiraceae bacterium]|nr:hypothetical protein [Saprospiraceae bacterium]